MVNNSVCCIIVTYNIGKKFYGCFNAIFNQVEQVVIVDNGSNKETIEILQDIEKTTSTIVLYNENNLGIAAALNRGVNYAKENNFYWVLTMDNDSIATESMVETMLYSYNSLEKREADKIVSIFPDYMETGCLEESDIVKKSDKENVEIEYLPLEITSGNLVKTFIFDLVGNFKEDLFIDMVDNDFCLRLGRLGYKLIRVKNAVLIHSLGNTQKKNLIFRSITYTNHSSLRRYYITRNRFYLWNEYKDIASEVIEYDKGAFKKEIVKIIFFENDKLKKINMIIRGYRDYKRNKFGPLDN
ncbi:glycosyltransferase [Clostridium folliculivorans]|uniref:glycosyltransferase n=1 Tax=Clostridium folliculivorans TaxID=2886038 RepID=UPI0021C280B5|nr:glycosyltransferase [Clostridium folliculivorans]GKU31668.1 glycosyl transferase [Clostridium folliculivorans]